ncbi:MAG: disulfide bond formation protein B [Reinekea sp.]|jgi:protein dithiol:quinone oxidoreductase
MFIHRLTNFFNSRWYWLCVVLTGLGVEGVALFYQHVLDEPPCVLCIQSRVWVLAGVLFGLVGLIGSNLVAIRLTAQLGLVGALGMVLNKSWTTVLVERGLYDGQCGMDPGFPSWFALDKWFPNVFEVWTMCGFTPNFLFGMTMGEGLVYGTSVLIATAVLALVLMILHQLRPSASPI